MIFDVFIEKLDEVTLNGMNFSAKQNGDWLEIYLNHGEMPAFKISLIETFHLVTVGKIRGLFDEWKKIADLCWEFASTPINERFPEKKYVLSAMRCVEGPVPVKQYVDAMNISTNNVEFHFGFANEKANAMEFTQEDLASLSGFFSKDAIDAMKEPAEDKDDEAD